MSDEQRDLIDDISAVWSRFSPPARRRLAMGVGIICVNALILLILWGAGAFITWTPNPGNWPESGRGLLAVIWFFVAIPVSVATAFEWPK